jgi:hypothetical protein
MSRKGSASWIDVKPAVKQAAMTALSGAAEYVLQKANTRVPLDEGSLQRSGIVSMDNGDKPVAHISYDTPYAKRLHEHPEYNFQNGRQGKWLETTIEQEKDKVNDYLKREIGRVLK